MTTFKLPDFSRLVATLKLVVTYYQLYKLLINHILLYSKKKLEIDWH